MNSTSISVITCSIKPELCGRMLESVKNTIGTNYETIVFDNREKKLGICQVYNQCAHEANYPYLCFIHEDVIMPNSHWGTHMVAFEEKTANCGVIGFAGGTIAKRNFLGWPCGSKGRFRYYDPPDGDKFDPANLRYSYQNPNNEDFAKVVTLDGLFLLVKKEIWEENPFDEKAFNGFHLYDADFTFGIAQKWQNYVCMTEDIYHFSRGNCDRSHYEYIQIFQKKWKHKLPYITGEQKITLSEEISSAKELLSYSLQYDIGMRKSIKHLLKINGLCFFILLCFSALIKKIYKIIIPKKAKSKFKS